MRWTASLILASRYACTPFLSFLIRHLQLTRVGQEAVTRMAMVNCRSFTTTSTDFLMRSRICVDWRPSLWPGEVNILLEA